MVQTFRRDESDVTAEDLRLRGLDAAANYEVTDLDAKLPTYDFRTRLDAARTTCGDQREARKRLSLFIRKSASRPRLPDSVAQAHECSTACDCPARR